MCYFPDFPNIDDLPLVVEKMGFVLVKEEAVRRAIDAGLITDDDLW